MCRLAALLAIALLPLAAQAQDGGVPAAALSDTDALRAELQAARKELAALRDEVHANAANQSVAQGWSEEFVDEKRKLETFVPDGYFRIRPELFHRFDLGRQADPSGYTVFPRSPISQRDRTNAGVNMRFRFEPTFNISSEVRIRAQVDALDNVLFGSTPDYAFSRNVLNNYGYDRDAFSIFSESQSAPKSGINALADSIAFKRVWGEVSTPVGILRFGRMGSHWGVGMLHNDGSCENCDFGDTVDRIMFVAEPFQGWFISPMVDFNAEGASARVAGGAPFDLSQSDDSHSFILAIARRDTESQAKAILEANRTVLNYGIHFTYRVQKNDPADFYGQAFIDEGTVAPNAGSYVPRNGSLFMPDLWLKLERKNFRIEAEFAGVLGNINNRAETGADAFLPGKNQALGVIQFGGVLQGEYRFLDGALRVGGEVGFASGDPAPGFGNYPRRKVSGADNNTQYGDIDGPQYACQATGGCTDSTIKNFRFNRDYRVDMILFREILGGVTDAIYFKPTIDYRITEGFHVFGAGIYSRAVFAESTPSAQVLTNGTVQADANLGLELNVGARYQTEDGFFGELRWGILFPLGGFADPRPNAPTTLDSAQALRAVVGIHF